MVEQPDPDLLRLFQQFYPLAPSPHDPVAAASTPRNCCFGIYPSGYSARYPKVVLQSLQGRLDLLDLVGLAARVLDRVSSRLLIVLDSRGSMAPESLLPVCLPPILLSSPPFVLVPILYFAAQASLQSLKLRGMHAQKPHHRRLLAELVEPSEAVAFERAQTS
jgi:hypothetical protein